MSDEFDGRVLNPEGVLIDLPFWVFKRLKKLNLLERDHETGRQYLKENPLCIACLEIGRPRVATVVDHVVPHKGDSLLFWDRSNWQALCKPCHDRKTASSDGRWG